MNKLRSALKSKTVRFAILLSALSALQGFVLAVNIDPAEQAIIGFILSAAIIVLRFQTKTALFDK